MKTKPTSFLAGLFAAAIISSTVEAALIISDDYNVTGSGTGFALGSGVNSGINPPTTRLTGSAAANLRYIKAFGAKADSAHYITNNTKFGISRIATDSSTMSLSTGSGPFDFGPALNTLAATPGLPAVYELTINISNGRPDGQRCSFAISSASGTAGTWDFGIQIYRNTTSDPSYTLQKRVSAGACGGTALNSVVTTVGTYGAEVSFFIRVTDAGAESSAFNSRVQVSTNAGVSWIYDSSTDGELTSGFRFPTSSRYVFWDIAGGAGPVLYDNFTLNWISGPTAATRTWNGGGADDNWNTATNWGGVAPSTGDSLVFNGTTRPTNTNNISDLSVPWVAFNNGGFALHGNAFTNSGTITNLAGTNILNGELAWGSTAAKTWSIASGSELVLNNLNTIEVNGDHNIYGGGTLRLKGLMNIGVATTANPPINLNEGNLIIDGGTITTRGGYRIGSLASGAAAQTIVTNGGSLSITATSGNLRVGDSANPQGARLDINNGTVSLVGSAIFAVGYATGATGTVSQTGGLVSVPIVSFSHSGVGSGTYTIKNGTLSTRVIRENNASGLSAIYFDNAILNTAAGASNAFFSGLDVAEIQSGGLALDALSDVAIDQALTGVGSLSISAVDSGHVYLNGVNTYSGNTTVTNGTLGGTGSIGGNLVMLGGTNAPGMSVGTFTVNGNATLGGTTVMELNRDLSPNSDRLVVGGTLTYGGILEVVLAEGAAEPQEGDTFQLFNKGSGSSFSAISLPPLSGSLTWNTSNLAANGSISVNGSATQPIINSVYSSGGNLILSGTGGVEGNPYAVLSSTNITLPKTNWTPLVTNTFGPGGSFSVTNAIDPAKPVNFFQLRAP